MPDKPYSSREIDFLFKGLEKRLFDEDEGFLVRIERQTTRTNGRVTKLERALLIFGTVVAVLLVTSGSELVAFLRGII